MSDAKHLVPFAQRSPARGLGRGDPFLPLINVAYLLLTFFLLVLALRTGAEIADQGGAVTLRVEANGVLHFEGRTMSVSEAVAAVRGTLAATPRGPLDIQADRSTPASTILPLLQKLQEGGIASIRLVPVPRLGPS
ncbi:MAG TPA: biopolymer transporter ExbD [Dongiaceae bacterium]